MTMLINHPFSEIKAGDSATLTRTLTPHDIDMFAIMSGEVHPADVDAAWAASDRFLQIVAHGMWGGTLISTVLGTQLPGPGTVLLHQALDFLIPVAVGDRVAVTVKVEAMDPVHESVRLTCSVVNQRDELVIAGTAVVIAPHDKITRARVSLPMHEAREAGGGYRKLIAMTAGMAPLRTAVVHPVDKASLGAALEAAALGLVVPVLVGPAQKIHAAASEGGFDLAGIEIVDVEHSTAAAEKAAIMAGDGEVEALMKGALHTDELMHAVLAPAAHLRTARRMSHVFAIDAPAYPRALFITDAALNLTPDLATKRDILQNAIDLVRALGIVRPRVAVLCAVETVNPAMPSTLDAAALCKMAERGQVTGALVDGPLAFDNAVSAQAALIKGIISPVAGHADILLVPDLEAGNMLAKQLEYLGGAQMAGIVLGARVPVILTSRADPTLARLGSCAIALLLARHVQGPLS
ncbi:MAG: bifunctional enoyl-CoA hydratase/phosphate acetyltransferase [Pseudomonadota bacterium]|nr:bifunctional enoyl-CoA hydratase/phosphate acetyltransferase [Pseudomonadota bacterium]